MLYYMNFYIHIYKHFYTTFQGVDSVSVEFNGHMLQFLDSC